MWGGGCLEPPLGARGGPTRAAGLPDFRGSVLSVPVVGSRVVPVFFRSRPFFLKEKKKKKKKKKAKELEMYILYI